METTNQLKRPSKEEREKAMSSYDALSATLEAIKSDNPEIEIEELNEKIQIPLIALKLLADVLKEISKGRPVSIVPFAAEMTTQAAADLLGCSRPHLVKLLDSKEMPSTKVGRHRRVKYEDVINYKKNQREKRIRLLTEVMRADEEDGLYDS